MYFERVEACSTQVGELLYIEKDYALDFFPRSELGDNFVLRYLNFIFDSSTRCASYVEGLFYPRDRWIPQSLELPAIEVGSFAYFDETFGEGDVIGIDYADEWKALYDPQTQWLCFGNPQREKGEIALEFATNTVAVLYQQQIKALWFKPTIYPTYPDFLRPPHR